MVNEDEEEIEMEMEMELESSCCSSSFLVFFFLFVFVFVVMVSGRELKRGRRGLLWWWTHSERGARGDEAGAKRWERCSRHLSLPSPLSHLQTLPHGEDRGDDLCFGVFFFFFLNHYYYYYFYLFIFLCGSILTYLPFQGERRGRFLNKALSFALIEKMI